MTNKDTIRIKDSVTIMAESNYLFYSNREKVSILLNKKLLNKDDIIDIFIGLHIVLELGINNVFRKIISSDFKKDIDTHIMINNLDNINFIDKTIMFIYYSKFKFTDISEATRYHSIINKIKSFSEMRNKLLHGYSISEISGENGIFKSKLKKDLNLIKLKQQLEDFKFILDGLCYYLDCVESSWTTNGKNLLKETYLNHNFIPETIGDLEE